MASKRRVEKRSAFRNLAIPGARLFYPGWNANEKALLSNCAAHLRRWRIASALRLQLSTRYPDLLGGS
jgi:hypothetical protein